jgi:hypothetical protein
MTVRDDIHIQIVSGLKDAKFPLNTPEELLASFPAGASTTCRSGDLEVTAGEAGKLLTPADFPFRDAKHVADTIVDRAGL